MSQTSASDSLASLIARMHALTARMNQLVEQANGNTGAMDLSTMYEMQALMSEVSQLNAEIAKAISTSSPTLPSMARSIKDSL